MEFLKRTVTSRPGLTQEQALESLQGHPQFKAGTKIASLRRRDNKWVANILEPKTAEFPPKSDDEGDHDAEASDPVEALLDAGDSDSEDAPEDGPSKEDDSDDSDSKPEPPKGEKSKDDDGDEKSEKGELGEILDLLHGIADKLGIDLGEGDPLEDAGPGAEELPVPPPGPHAPPKPPAGPPAGGPPPGRPPAARPTKPGEAPPGVTPIGTPAFSAAQVPTITVETDTQLTIKQAKQDLDKQYGPKGYKVKQMKREGKFIRALLSNR